MKISVIVGVAVEASHFRAIGFTGIQNSLGGISVSRSQAWRRISGGYGGGGCTAAHVAAQAVSAPKGSEACMLQSTHGGSCGSLSSQYIVTDVEDSLGDPNDYCYGYKQDDFVKPSGPYKITWNNCCWVDMTADDGTTISGDSYGFTATFNDPDNNSPQVKLPPIWKILSGCSAQTLDLNPIDLDGDTVRCRFANSQEGLGAFRGGNFNSITLDETSCVLTYDGTQDMGTDGVKPIAVQIEDFDENNTLLSSVPVQFLATVWTPTNANFNHRQLSKYEPGNPFVYQPFFEMGGDDDVGRDRRQVNLPSYCMLIPVLIAPSPAAGSILAVPLIGITISLKAQSDNGAITRFQFNSPQGMVCTAVNGAGEASCSFTPSLLQQGQLFPFCFMADDAAGLSTERRCISFNVGSVLVTQPPSVEVTDIFSMTLHLIPTRQGDFNNYGCAGIDDMDHTAKTAGIPLDEVDRQLNRRKHCINCAIRQYSTGYTPYDYDENNNLCGLHLLF